VKEFDLTYINNEIKFLAGTDEAGRGPLAGPVVAAAVIFEKDTFIQGINDSKKLSEKKRERLFDEIINSCLTHSACLISNDEIDRINILQASMKAMELAVSGLSVVPDKILVDGNRIPKGLENAEFVIKGDAKSFSIAAASIIAKVTRDRIMLKLAGEYPNYGWERNKGYPTSEHYKAIEKFGLTPYHRKTFLRLK